MNAETARSLLISTLSDRYGAGEAAAITRIVFEDAFDRGRQFNLERFELIMKRLEAGEPLQYVLGEADFFGLKFKVNPAVLIPRQETEELVAWALEYINGLPEKGIRVLDIGLGSGCIGISIKKKRPEIRLYGLEKSPEALTLARENATHILGPDSVTFQAGDILNRNSWAKLPATDLIISNPPYIPEQEKQLVPEHVAEHEPHLALFVPDADPLLFYREITAFAQYRNAAGSALFFECNEFNAGEVAALLENLGCSHVRLRKDLAGAERMVSAFI